MAKDALESLDSTIDIVTPENIAFHYRAAGPFRRLPAFLIDVFILWAFWVGVTIAMMFAQIFSGVNTAVMLVIWFVSYWFYGGFFETYMNGQTPGKWTMGIRVVTTQGQPINGLQAIIRNILRLVDTAPLLPLHIPIIDWMVLEATGSHAVPMYVFPTFMVGLVVMAMNRRYQRCGDLVCGTMVIREEKHWLSGVAKMEDRRTPKLAELIPADFVASRTMAQALSMYVERRKYFTPAKRNEVAAHLAEPLKKRFGLRSDTSSDLLLCALYYRTFVTDVAGAQPAADIEALSPFAPPAETSGVQILSAKV